MPDFFSPIIFSWRAELKILLGVAKPFSMVLPPLVGLFLKRCRCSKLPAHLLISNDSIFFIYKFKLWHSCGNIEHFQSFKKAERATERIWAKKIVKSVSNITKNDQNSVLRRVCRPDSPPWPVTEPCIALSYRNIDLAHFCKETWMQCCGSGMI